jgi:HPt (histidine-containing phosphotransfer) domain-containing protein
MSRERTGPAVAPPSGAEPLPEAEVGERRARREALARLRRFGGDRLVRDMAVIFVTDMPERIALARAGVSAGDAGRVAYAAHTMKSSSAQFGALALARACEQAEHAARGAHLGALAARVEAIEREFAAFRAWLESDLTPAERPVADGPSGGQPE